jgi:MinD superfamily P-loop ATPase
MRCKACDSTLEPSEIIWQEHRQQHEDLCKNCRDCLNDVDDANIHYIDDIDHISG